MRIAFGIMGGWNQSQAHAQFVSNVVDHGMNIQAALEAARFTKLTFGGCDVHRGIARAGDGRASGWRSKGHEIDLQGAFSSLVGGGQSVMRDDATGVNYGASDPRKDGAAIPEPFLPEATCRQAFPATRWIQLLLGLVCMIVISSPQYVWALFTQPLTAGARRRRSPELQITFSILIVVQTFLSPWQGVLVDRFGPRLLLSIGVRHHRTELGARRAGRPALPMLYLTYGLLGGIGTGIVYVGVIGHMVQWFPDKRGLATGLVAAGYGIGALLTTFPIAAVLRESTYQDALTRFGLIFAVVGLARGAGAAAPGRGAGRSRGISASARSASRRQTPADVTPLEMLAHADLLADVRR